MKRTFIAISFIASIAILSGCGNEQKTDTQEATTQNTHKVGFVTQQIDTTTTDAAKQNEDLKKQLAILTAKLEKVANDLSKNVHEKAEELKQKTSPVIENAITKAKELKDKATPTIEDAKEKAKKVAIEASDTVKHALSDNKYIPMTKDEISEVMKENKLFQGKSLTVEKGYKTGDFYALKLSAKTPRGEQRFTVFIDKDTGRTFVGGGFEKDGTKMAIPADLKVVENGVLFTYGKGDKEIYVVTDPECPYCQMMESQAKNNLENNYKVNVILYLHPLHKKAPKMSAYILDANNSAEMAKRMHEVMVEKSDKWKDYNVTDQKRVDSMLKDAAKAADELGARGTPAVFEKKGLKEINWSTLRD